MLLRLVVSGCPWLRALVWLKRHNACTHSDSPPPSLPLLFWPAPEASPAAV